jgi:hypothetical protein
MLYYTIVYYIGVADVVRIIPDLPDLRDYPGSSRIIPDHPRRKS